MLRIIKENKILSLIILLFIIIMAYCSFNTMIINDDLGYSFLYRTDTRITNLIQVFKMQISDYKIVNSRVFVHTIVQLLLIFGKNVWAILNPIVICLNFYIINKIIKLYYKNSNKLFNYLICLVCFMLIISFKWIIYWVSGSVNYVWTSTVLFLGIYLYLKYGLSKNNYVNMLAVLIISILHESTYVFSFIFVISIILQDLIFFKKIDKKKLLLFFPLIISGLFLFLGPGTFSRIGQNSDWNKKSIFEKFRMSLPVVSFNIYNVKNIYNIVPNIFILLSIISIFKSKCKSKNIIILLNIILLVLIVLTNNNWLYFLLSIFILLNNFYVNHTNNRDDLSLILLSFYAVSYSLCLTVEYVSGRPNYFIFIYMIMMIIIYIYDLTKDKKINYFIPILLALFTVLLINEVGIYTQIGKIKKNRLEAIENYKKGKTNKLIYELADEKYNKYQIDINEPYSKDYYAYRYFLNYYGIDDSVEFKYVGGKK